MFTRKIQYIAASVFVLLVVFALGVLVGERNIPAIERITDVGNKERETVAQSVDFSPFWEVWQTLDRHFVATGEAASSTDQDRVWGAISGMVDALGDPYTVFLPPQESALFEEDISGNFGGVGMEIGKRDDLLTVIAPLKGSPAERAGIHAGDGIVAIDEVSTVDMSVDEAVRRIRGEPGTKVLLTLYRDESALGSFDVAITRDIIQIPTLETELRSDGIFIIRLFNFNATAPREFRQALSAFMETGSTELILDMRGNPGGFLEAAIDIASWFLPSGKVVVTESFDGRGQEPRAHRSRGYSLFDDALKMVILVDRGSASASEIVAGALQEHGVATLVGTQTYGKGSVQELVTITADTSLKVTVAEWLTPNGNSISAGGLAPDVVVERTLEDFEAGRDPQLDRAVEFLRAQ